MKTLIRWLLRLGVLAALVGALLDVKRPGDSPRHRVYLIDASASVETKGSSDSFTPSDALRLVADDLKHAGPDDTAAVLAFGERLVTIAPKGRAREITSLQISGIEKNGSRLADGLDGALAMAEGGDILLFTDGRSTGGDIAPALARAKALGVPVHCFTLGPVAPQDARIRSVDVPSSVRPDTVFTTRVSVQSLAAWSGNVILKSNDLERRVLLQFKGSGTQDVVFDSMRAPQGASSMQISIRIEGEKPDACPENDQANVIVWVDDARVRVRVIESSGSSSIAALFPKERFDVTVAADLRDASAADVVVIEKLPADRASVSDLKSLADSVRQAGVGLVVFGGPAAYALGGYANTPLEQALPVWAFPDERSAVVVVLDRSGSMNSNAPNRTARRIDDASAAISNALGLMHLEDQIGVVSFADSAQVDVPLTSGSDRGRIPTMLSRISPGGTTVIAPALRQAIDLVKSSKWGRRRIMLVTDGESMNEDLKAIGAQMVAENIKLTIIRTADSTSAALSQLVDTAEIVDAHDYALLDKTFAAAFARSKDLTASPAVPIMLSHDLFRGLPGDLRVDRINRTTTKPGTEIAAIVADHPVIVFGRSGLARTAALMVGLDKDWAGNLGTWSGLPTLLVRVVEHSIPDAGTGSAEADLRFEESGLRVSMRLKGSDRPDKIGATLQRASGNTEPLSLPRRGENLYEAVIAADTGMYTLRFGGRILATRSRLASPEFEEIGPNPEVLKKICNETGGRTVEVPADIARLDRRTTGAPKSARGLLIGLAILLIFLDAGAGVFIK